MAPKSQPADAADGFIDRLLAGPDGPVLSPRELALVEARLKQPVPLSQIQREKQTTGESETNAKRNKLELIRDFNRHLLASSAAHRNDEAKPEKPTDDPHKLAMRAKRTSAPKREPSPDAIACYRVFFLKGMKQQPLADYMTKELKRPISQGAVSRWLREVKKWIEAGNILPDLPEPLKRKPDSIDAGVIEMGQREDGLTPRQRNRRSEDSDD